MTTLAEVEVAIRARLDPLMKSSKEAEKRINELDKKLERAGKKSSAAFKSTTTQVNALGRSFKNLGIAAAAAFSVKQIQEYADAWILAGNKIRSVEVATGKQARSLQGLNRLASISRSGFTETVDLYAKLFRATEGVAKSEEEVARATETVSKAFKAGGAAASEQRNAILQLGQALGSGVLQGDELRSIRENAPVLARAIAEEFNTTVAGLKKLGSEGELTADRIFKAILKASSDIDKQFAATASTIEDSINIAKNALTEMIGTFDGILGISNEVIKFFKEMAENIDAVTEAAKRMREGDIKGAISAALNPKAGNIHRMLRGMNDIVPFYKDVQKLTEAFDEFRSSVSEYKPDALKQYDELEQKLINNEIKADEAKESLKKLFADDPMYTRLLDVLDEALDKFKQIENLRRAQAFSDFPMDNRGAGFKFLAERDSSRKFIDEQLSDSKRTDKEIAIDKEAERLEKAAKEAGVALTEAAAKILATTIVANREISVSQSNSLNKAAEIIRDFEQFRSTAYWDVNAYRTGFGSDTVTLDDGTIQKVTKATTTSLANANRDLLRRITEFQEVIVKQIGSDTFKSFNEDQQAALTSIAYNYGSLPERIVQAIKSGNQETIVQAIRGLGSDNSGINKNRRNSEADLFLNGSPSGVKTSISNQDKFKEYLLDTEREIELLNQKANALGLVNPMQNDYGYSVTKAEIAQKLLNNAQENGIEITPKLREEIDKLAEGYARATAKGEQLKDTNQKLASSMDDIAETGKNILGGFISDLREGKSASEALANALNKVADKLMDIALDALFGTGSFSPSAGGGGGLFSGLISALFGGLFAEGGRPPKNKVSVVGEKGPELFVPDSSGVIVPNRQLKPNVGYASGGKTDMNIHLITDDASIAGIAKTEIKKAAPGLVKVSVAESQKQTKSNMSGYIANAQARQM